MSSVLKLFGGKDKSDKPKSKPKPKLKAKPKSGGFNMNVPTFTDEQYEKGFRRPNNKKLNVGETGPKGKPVMTTSEMEYEPHIRKLKTNKAKQSAINAQMREDIQRHSKEFDIYDDVHGRWITSGPGHKKDTTQERAKESYPDKLTWMEDRPYGMSLEDREAELDVEEKKAKAKIIEEDYQKKQWEQEEEEMRILEEMVKVDDEMEIEHEMGEWDTTMESAEQTKTKENMEYEKIGGKKMDQENNPNAKLPSDEIQFGEEKEGLRNRKKGQQKKPVVTTQQQGGHVWNNNVQEGSKMHEELLKGKGVSVASGGHKYQGVTGSKKSGVRPIGGGAIGGGHKGGAPQIGLAAAIANYSQITEGGKRPFFSNETPGMIEYKKQLAEEEAKKEKAKHPGDGSGTTLEGGDFDFGEDEHHFLNQGNKGILSTTSNVGEGSTLEGDFDFGGNEHSFLNGGMVDAHHPSHTTKEDDKISAIPEDVWDDDEDVIVDSPPTTPISKPPTTTTSTLPESKPKAVISKTFSMKPVNGGIQKRKTRMGLEADPGLNYAHYMTQALESIPKRYGNSNSLPPKIRKRIMVPNDYF